MNLPTRQLYKISLAFIGAWLLLAGVAFGIHHGLIGHLPHPDERAPAVSPDSNVEFESGALRRGHP